MSRLAAVRAWLALLGLFAISTMLLLWPAAELTLALRDPDLGGPAPAAQSWRWHRALTPAFEQWARERRASDRAVGLALDQIAETEWPLFGAVFYLRATENLDRAWERAPRGPRPREYARGAIDAAVELLVDPRQATWVQKHWGADEYLRRENVFYRMLLIDALATQARLGGAQTHRALLREQTQSLARELAQSPSGLLADYPGQTFPADVAAAWYAILRADAVLGTDHSAQARAGERGFTGAMAPELELPPYAWYGARDPEPTEVRGCANAWLLHNAPFVWPQRARVWDTQHHVHFRQRGLWLHGYREFPAGSGDEIYADVDSGPVIAGIGTSATAFGLGAARVLGRQRTARAIGLQAVAFGWPMPNGRLLGARLMSHWTDAPLLGEAALLYNLSLAPAPGFEAAPDDAAAEGVPGLVWLVLVLQWVLGVAGLYRCAVRLRRMPWRTA